MIERISTIGESYFAIDLVWVAGKGHNKATL
jgi:hypothetical protein